MKSNLVYFISDIHLGLDIEGNSSKDREIKLGDWLCSISESASEIYFLGDIFDYWFEFKNSYPPQYHTFYKALKKLKSEGVSIFFFTGNHDMWMKDYFPNEFGIEVYHNQVIKEIWKKKFYLAHGDGLGKGDHFYKLLKTIMRNPISMILFSLLPQKLGYGIMKSLSQRSRQKHGDAFQDFDQERLVDYCIEDSKTSNIDFYIMGHRHLMIDYEISPNGPRYINLGDWLNYESFAVFDGHTIYLKSLSGREKDILKYEIRSV